ncbi:hypothetical protein HOLleu_12249 [Holothuria leucospilota]|uniref:Uncharacterized protein n=1 Tax=Holothuria leucospilota TaxID=206669 RepID=A0A9Q1CB05_HOLLE|nr:hypothetical protein HOLleu_12249 [Holothuria leucospilota]
MKLPLLGIFLDLPSTGLSDSVTADAHRLDQRNINYKYNDVPSVTDTTTSEGHPTWRLRQPLFTKIATSSTGRATRKKRSGLRHKSWRLTNLKLYTNFSENDVQVSKSKLIPSDAISNEQR